MNRYEKYAAFVPAECRAIVEGMIEQARANIEKDGYLSPCAVVGVFGGELHVVGGLANVSKDVSAAIVRAHAKRAKADFVLLIDEVWLKEMEFATPEEAREFQARRILDGGPEVREMPGRIDAVMFQLETYAGNFMGTAIREDKPDAPGKPGKYTFGKVTFSMSDETMGRFVGLLPLDRERR